MNPKCFVILLVALVAQVYSYPSTRERRQAAAYAGPDGAVAGAGSGGARVGAGCAGLNCGVRLGDYSIGTPQIFGSRGSSSYASSYENYDDEYNQGKGRQVQQASRRSDNVNNATEPETSETFITGVTLTERIDSVRGFLASIFRGVQDAISSLFRRPETRVTANPTSSVSTPATAASNRTYSIVLGTPSSAASNLKTVTVTLPSVVDNSENDILSKTKA